MATIRIEHTDGTVETLEHLKNKIIKKFGETDLGRLFTPRALANQISLEEGRDEVYLERDDGTDEFGGRLKDVEQDGSSVELVVDSWERDARTAEPTPAGQRRENVADDVLIKEAVDAVPGLSAGTIQQLETGLTFVFSHSSQAKKIRTVEEATPGEVRYNADKTVDYVNRLGQDRSDSVTISPKNQNLDGKIKVKKNGGEKNVTHLRMLGAGEGQHQMVVNIVPDTDTASYPNKVTYTNHDWEEGDFKDWDTFINKEVTATATLEREGLTLIDELNSRYVELKATIKDVDVVLGDTVYVEKPKDNIDQPLRIVEWQRIDDKDGLRYDCVLSSRQKTREKPGTKDRKDIQRYNKSFEGSPVTMTAGGGRQPVSNNLDYEFDFYYPAEVEYEHRVKLFVKGLAYRAYSQGAAAGGDHFHSVDVTHPEHSHGVDLPFSNLNHDHDVDLSFTTPSATADAENTNPSDLGGLESGSLTEQFDYPVVDGDGSVGLVYVDVQCITYADNPNQFVGSGQLTIKNTTKGRSLYSDDVLPSYSANSVRRHFVADVGGTLDGDTLEWTFDVGDTDTEAEFRFSYGATLLSDHTHNVNESTTAQTEFFDDSTQTSNTELGTTTSESSNASGDHAHDPSPGVIESFSGTRHYPSNCNVIVNGQSVGASMGDGSGSFEEQVDLAGMLNPGQVNTVRISSESLGHIQANLDVDVYRQILGDG